MSVRTVALACFRKSYFFLRYPRRFTATPIERAPPPHEPLPLAAICQSIFGSYFSRTLLSKSVHYAYRRSRSGESVLTETKTARGRGVEVMCVTSMQRETHTPNATLNHFPLEYCMYFIRLSRVQKLSRFPLDPRSTDMTR